MIVQTSLPTYDDLPKNQIKHICEKQGIGVKEFVYSFNSIMNALAMGTTTQGNVAHSMFKETIR